MDISEHVFTCQILPRKFIGGSLGVDKEIVFSIKFNISEHDGSCLGFIGGEIKDRICSLNKNVKNDKTN